MFLKLALVFAIIIVLLACKRPLWQAILVVWPQLRSVIRFILLTWRT